MYSLGRKTIEGRYLVPDLLFRFEGQTAISGKFHYPLPDGFIPRGAQQSGMHRLATGKVASTSFNDQADSGHGSCLRMPIWTSSTVQTGWIWPHSTETDSSPDQELCLIKRQSICELEGDATVDGVYFKPAVQNVFTSFSDMFRCENGSVTCPNVEEYERTGVHEEVIHSDPSKSLPENFLKTLSHGPEFEDALLYICSKAEKSSSSQGPPSEDAESMFVLLKGRTMKESFSIGQELASVITLMNPVPVTLKMEKVYHPCFLLMKKRYVGYSYETPDQVEPSFDAKGIETVKAYLQRQWTRILAGRVSLHDFVFAKEVRLGTYSNRSSSLPPAAIVAIKAMKTDPRAEP
ncbi:hypothetical protein IFM89_007194 [Coptis chinensis]|uniref:DNA-directed DNA polymerase n=1 Tax=Coptis chinensis TaxID=261450 RepID=A0A835LQT0_9MAGN|nr:hypothetical protein IFM89_007194 [Coptis chinensis]